MMSTAFYPPAATLVSSKGDANLENLEEYYFQDDMSMLLAGSPTNVLPLSSLPFLSGMCTILPWPLF
jgi:hypothetical protein